MVSYGTMEITLAHVNKCFPVLKHADYYQALYMYNYSLIVLCSNQTTDRHNV